MLIHITAIFKMLYVNMGKMYLLLKQLKNVKKNC